MTKGQMLAIREQAEHDFHADLQIGAGFDSYEQALRFATWIKLPDPVLYARVYHEHVGQLTEQLG